MKESPKRRAGLSRLLLTLVLAAAGGFAQQHVPAFEKQGTFFMPGVPRARGLGLVHDAAGPQTAPLDVVSYQLDLTLAMEREDFGGSTLITLVLRVPSDSVQLNQLKLQIDSVKVDGIASAFESDDSAETMTVHLGRLRAAGDTLRLTCAYRRLPGIPRLTQRLGYFFFKDTIPGLPANLGYTMSEPREARAWMPCFDEPFEKATAQIRVTVPQGYVAASNGTLLGVRQNGDGTVTWNWREDHQIATYLMCVTVSRFTVPSLVYTRAPGDSIPLQYYAWVRDSAVTASFLPVVRQMMTNLEALFGPYPWDKYAMASISPFAYGGMEHQTMTTLNEALQTNQDVVVHELAHQWWGDLVTCGSWPDVWLNESFATYSEALWRETIGGTTALRRFMKDLEHFFYGSWSGAVYDPEGQGFNLFDDVVYSKGGWVLHTLRGVVGDSAFFRSLRKWRDLYAEKSAVTADFQSVVESVTGTPMDWFFREWIYGPGWPVYSCSYRQSGDSVVLRISQEQAAGVPLFTMPIQMRAYSAGEDTTFVVRDSLRVQDFRLALKAPPDSIVLDPDGWILKERGGPIDPPPGDNTLPFVFELKQNFPNPFNSSTDVVYTLSAPGNVTLTVYDVLGRNVATVVEEYQSDGEHRVRFNGANYASGVYLLRLSSHPSNGGTSTEATRKMMLVK